MHEMAITQEVLKLTLDEAHKADAQTVKQINLVIGDLSSIIDDSVQFYFDFLSQETIARGAKLIFRRIPLQVRCRRCMYVFTPKTDLWQCPKCQQHDVDIVSGKEFYLDSIEVE